MPNHCSNLLFVFGPSTEVKRFVDATTKVEPQQNPDPTPDIQELDRRAHSPNASEADIQAYEAESRRLSIKKSKEEPIAIFAKLYPIPDELRGGRVGQSDGGWYHWCNTHWGTKWGDYDTNLNQANSECAIYSFTTAWGPGLEGMEEISKAFPSLRFVYQYHELGDGFYGASLIMRGHFVEQQEETVSELYIDPSVTEIVKDIARENGKNPDEMSEDEIYELKCSTVEDLALDKLNEMTKEVCSTLPERWKNILESI